MRYGSYTSACLIAASICVAMGLRISSAMWPMTPPNVRPIKAKALVICHGYPMCRAMAAMAPVTLTGINLLRRSEATLESS